MKKVRLDFGNLPLVDAAIRVSFQRQVPLKYAVINSVASSLKPDFPILTEPQQIEVAPGIISSVELGPGLLPGAVYAGHASGLSISVHPHVIVARWIEQLGSDEKKYPRFPRLRDALWAAVEAFQEAVQDDFPGVAVVNMSYVNFLPASDPAFDVATYLSDRARLAAMNDAHRIRKLEAAWSESADVDVRFVLEQVTAKLPHGVTDGYRLTTAAGIRLAGAALDAKSGLERVHDQLQVFFMELISSKARTDWKLTEVPGA